MVSTEIFKDQLLAYFSKTSTEETEHYKIRIFDMALQNSKAIIAGECVYSIIAANYDNIDVIDVYVNIENTHKFISSLVSYSVCYDIIDVEDIKDVHNPIPDNITYVAATLTNKMFQITNNYEFNGTMFSMYNKIYGCLKIEQKFLFPVPARPQARFLMQVFRKPRVLLSWAILFGRIL